MKQLKPHLLCVLILFGFHCSSRANQKLKNLTDTVFNVTKFGAKGDGISDNYNALKKVTDLANHLQHAVIYFPKGVYYVARYNSDSSNKFDLKFTNCDNIVIKGDNAVISLNGKFKRSADIKKGRFSYSNENGIVPFYFMNCKNISISGIEINGNANKMSRDNGVVEKGQGLITCIGSSNIYINNVFIHHSASDGIYIGKAKSYCTRLTIINTKCLNNARQGLSITGLRGAYIKSCSFSNTGFTGTYGFHRPAAGVDIEPTNIDGTMKTGNILFEDCSFENNIGGQFLCTQPSLTSNIILRNCKFTGIDSFSHYQLILAADSVVVDNCILNLGRGNIFPTWKAFPGSHVTIENSTISSSLNGILSASKDKSDTVILKNNNFKFTGDTLSSFFPYLQTTNLYFINNKIFIPSKVHKLRGTNALVANAIISKGNKFYSDNDKKPIVSYSGTKKVEDE